jgi:hypothetical protein
VSGGFIALRPNCAVLRTETCVVRFFVRPLLALLVTQCDAVVWSLVEEKRKSEAAPKMTRFTHD